MQPTPRLRVLSDIIPRVLGVCLFMQGVIRKYGGNAHMSGLHRDINVPRNFLSSRRLQKPRERMGGRTGPGAGRAPSPLGRPPYYRDQSGPVSRIMLHWPKGSRRTVQSMSVWSTAQIHLRGLYKQTPWPLEEAILNPHYSLAYFPKRIQRERFLRLPTS